MRPECPRSVPQQREDAAEALFCFPGLALRSPQPRNREERSEASARGNHQFRPSQWRGVHMLWHAVGACTFYLL